MLTVPGSEQLLTSHVWTSCVPKLRGNFHVSQAFSKNDESRGVGASSCAHIFKFEVKLNKKAVNAVLVYLICLKCNHELKII